MVTWTLHQWNKILAFVAHALLSSHWVKSPQRRFTKRNCRYGHQNKTGVCLRLEQVENHRDRAGLRFWRVDQRSWISTGRQSNAVLPVMKVIASPPPARQNVARSVALMYLVWIEFAQIWRRTVIHHLCWSKPDTNNRERKKWNSLLL